MSSTSSKLPPRPNLEHLRKQAKRLLREQKARGVSLTLQQVQHALALQYGARSWADLTSSMVDPQERLVRYLGSPVGPPRGLDRQYAGEPMTAFIRDLMRESGWPVLDVQVDDSEFPILVGAALQGELDHGSLRDAIGRKADSGYDYAGCSSSRRRAGLFLFAVNLVPERVLDLSPQRRELSNRLMLRLETLRHELELAADQRI